MNNDGHEPESDLAEKMVDEVLANTRDFQGNALATAQTKLGVIQRTITAVAAEGDMEYLQALLLAAFDDKQEAMLCADAISERIRYGVPIEPILARIAAQCGIKAGRTEAVLRAVSHYTVTQYTGGKEKKTGPEKARY